MGKVGLMLVCEVCGKKLVSRQKKYCSAECKAKAVKPKRTFKKQCKVCKKIFIGKSYSNKYCSVECRRIGMSKSFRTKPNGLDEDIKEANRLGLSYGKYMAGKGIRW